MAGGDGKVAIASPAGAVALRDARWGGVLVAGADAAAVGEAVAALRAAGVRACGFVGDPAAPEAAEMAAELFPGMQVVSA